jgi:putative tryptophan/tyrosine transport system substrate-binding protein
MKRRDFVHLVGGAASMWPLAAHAQQRPMPLVAFLNGGSPDGYGPMVAAFRQGLKEAGFVEGQNVAVEYRWAGGQYDRVPAMALELLGRQVAVIVANTPGALAIKAAITTIPIVFTTGDDPVRIGLVASLARPGDNVTGVTNLSVEVGQKKVEWAHELVSTAPLIAVLINPIRPTSEAETRDLQAAARILGVQLHVLHASTERDFDTVFATLAQLRPGALVIGNDGFFNGRSEQLAALALRHAVPAISQDRAFAVAGGLMSYGASITDLYRQAGIYTGRVLKGEKPADLPVMRPTKFEFVINLQRHFEHEQFQGLSLRFGNLRPKVWQCFCESLVSPFGPREGRERLRHGNGRHLRLVRPLGVGPNLGHVLVAADAGDVVLGAARFRHDPDERLPQPVRRTVRQACGPACGPEPVAEPRARERQARVADEEGFHARGRRGDQLGERRRQRDAHLGPGLRLRQMQHAVA